MSLTIKFSYIIFIVLLISGCNNNSNDGNKLNQVFKFTDVTVQSGFDYEHGFSEEEIDGQQSFISGGVGTADYDGDGWVDLYVVRGSIGPNLLFRNLGNGKFQETGMNVGLDIDSSRGSGPTFADFDGDGLLDLFIGGISPTKPRLFKNTGNGLFQDVTETSGIAEIKSPHTFSAAFGDYDLDGDLDLFITHWSNRISPDSSSEHLWRNNGDGSFTDVSIESGITQSYTGEIDYSFTPNFADINSDGWPDLLIASDFETSKVFINNKDGSFTETTTDVISDENGMGAAVGDFDNDMDLDWFVSSIWAAAETTAFQRVGITGNRLYRNDGGGNFDDATEQSGVRNGSWGWGACFMDFNNDGYLDIFHVNGFGLEPFEAPEFFNDRSRLFVSNGDGTFSEVAIELELIDTGEGRGIVCFDYDKDGEIYS